MKKAILCIFCMMMFFPVLAKRAGSNKGRVVEVNFDDELLIKGKALGPSLFTLYQKRNIDFGRLIQPRKNFIPEMRLTLGDIEEK